MAKACRCRVVTRCDPGFFCNSIQLRHCLFVQVARLSIISAAKVEPQHGIAYSPVPVAVDVKSFKQWLVAFKQALKINSYIARVMRVQYAEHDLKCFSGFACG